MTKRLMYLVNDGPFFLSHRSQLAQAAKDRGYEVHVAVPPSDADERICSMGFTLHHVDIVRRSLAPHRELKAIAQLARLLRVHQPDVLHCVTLRAVVAGGIAARLAGVSRVVFAITGLGHLFTSRHRRERALRAPVGWFLRVLLAKEHTVTIVQNPDDQAVLESLGVPVSRVRLIRGSGVDPAEFSPTEEPEGTPLVLLASRLLWSKGVGDFVAAAQELRARGVSARFALVGEPDSANKSSVPISVLKEWHRTNVIEWWGRRHDMPAVLSQAAIVTLPSMYGEGVPKVLIEAAAAGRAIVTTNTPGCREIVRHEETGLLVPPRDSSALARALQRLLGDRTLRCQLGTAGRAHFEAGYALNMVVGETLGLYSAMLAEPASQPA